MDKPLNFSELRLFYNQRHLRMGLVRDLPRATELRVGTASGTDLRPIGIYHGLARHDCYPRSQDSKETPSSIVSSWRITRRLGMVDLICSITYESKGASPSLPRVILSHLLLRHSRESIAYSEFVLIHRHCCHKKSTVPERCWVGKCIKASCNCQALSCFDSLVDLARPFGSCAATTRVHPHSSHLTRPNRSITAVVPFSNICKP